MEDFKFEDSEMLYKPDFSDDFMGINSELTPTTSDFTTPDSQNGSQPHIFSPQQQQQHHHHHNHQQQQQNSETQKRTRASGEVLALLIGEFNKNQNPNAATRKKISDQTGMPERSVRIWFQNRRAKSRKLEKAAASDKEDPYTTTGKNFGLARYDNIPLNLNNNYFFIDSRSLTVGSWKRLKSGNLSNDNIFSVKNLSNLSPQSINEIMNNSTDLMVLISKKNFEINYFFSAITDNSKILFRIFYPISNVNNCSISFASDDENQDPSCELKLYLNKPPKFAVSFAHLIVQNNNQWSICDDFSEGHQVNDAFIGGSGVPHVFNGLEQSLRFMNSFILDYNSANDHHPEFNLPQRFDSKSPVDFSVVPQPDSIQQVTEEDRQEHHQQQQQQQQNPLLEQFVQENLTEFENFIQHPDSHDFGMNESQFSDSNFK